MFYFLTIVSLFAGLAASISILDFGAMPHDKSYAASLENGNALAKALQFANASSSDRVVLVPAGLNFTFFMVQLDGLRNVTLQIDGTLIVSNNISHIFVTDWPAAIRLTNAADVRLTGNGLIDGQGYRWWWYVIINQTDHRPHLVRISQSERLTIENVRMINSPLYHILLEDIKDVVVRNLEIHVDVVAQKRMLDSRGLLDKWGIPTFPLNTDGIDPSGINVLIENVTIENFDDAVAVKPMHSGGKFSDCSANMTIRNSFVRYGVGMTIGSVPPRTEVNCVRNVLFENIKFENAIKAIYIKSNPGQRGSGIIDNITYSNVEVNGSLWYPIWIGPQQQRQPGTNGTGCSFFYPIVKKCPAQPRVTISNITLRNVKFTRGWLLPGVLLCDAANPCTGFVFENVENLGPFVVQKSYVCEYVHGEFWNRVTPRMDCIR